MTSRIAARVPEKGLSRHRIQVTEWQVSNFKALEYASLPLHGLSLLTGVNSAGKSSLIQSLLLVAQSSLDEVILNGELVRLGEPRDLIRSGSDTLTLGFTTSQKNLETDLDEEWAYSIDFIANGPLLEASGVDIARAGEPVLSATKMRVTAQVRQEILESAGLSVEDGVVLRLTELFGRSAPPKTYLILRGMHPALLVMRFKEAQVLRGLKRAFREGDAGGPNLETFFELRGLLVPWRKRYGADLSEEIRTTVDQILRSPALWSLEGALPASEDFNALFSAYAETLADEGFQSISVRSMLRDQLGTLDRRHVQPILRGDLWESLRALEALSIAFQQLSHSVQYLGPLRDEPKVVSSTGGRSGFLPVGGKGEYTADLLYRSRNRTIRYFDQNRQARRSGLMEAVGIWSSELGIGSDLSVEDHGKLGRGLRLLVHGVERDLTTIGVGASQLLPVLTVVLNAPWGALVCLEQPELHLHPAVQSRLADFFMYARPDITLLVETHSEYLVTRLRRRAAEGAYDVGLLNVFFAEQFEGTATFRNMELDAEGDFIDWPEGFFDTQDEESRAIIRALAKARKAMRQAEEGKR